MAGSSLELVTDGFGYAEGLRWHDDSLWFSDLAWGQVWRVGSEGRRDLVADAIPLASGLGWTEAGDLLVVSIGLSCVLRVDAQGVSEPLVDPELVPGASTNDMATVGNWSYVTHAGLHHDSGSEALLSDQGLGGILLFDHVARTVREVASGMAMPNGVVVTPDRSTLIVAETLRNRIVEFSIGADGSLSDQRVRAELDGMVDGITLDAEDHVWVGMGVGTFVRTGPDGRVTDTIEVPGWSTIDPELGGDDGRSLFLATTRFEGPEALFRGEAEGRILMARVDVPGARWGLT